MELLKGIPEAEYHGWNRMSASALKTLDKSTPLHLLAERENRTDTPAFRVGRALHSLVLTPAAYELDFVVAPDIDRRTKAGKEEWEKFQGLADGRTILTRDEATLVDEMRGGIMSHESARMLVEKCGTDTEITLRGDWEGIPCKARIDGWIEEFGVIIDIKTHSGLASPQEFSRAAYNFGYWTQFAFYRELMRRAGKEVTSVILIVVEKTPPHACLCAALNADHLDVATARLPGLIDQYRKFLDEPGTGWPDVVTEIYMPNWATNDMMAPTGE
jgi:exodeoxyribonuclease VIII